MSDDPNFPDPFDSQNLDPMLDRVKNLLDEPPTQIGPYRILERIGSGGMGDVYRAEQRGDIHRVVAIKLIKPAFDTTNLLARFQAERQALAMMDHPNIAKIYDAGKDESGRPYFVMEYVPGEPVTIFADVNKFSMRQRLELFIQVCSAISHAHTKLIIHRDIKSRNVLAYFDAEHRPVVKVIDFGIAKALSSQRLSDATLYTHYGAVVGTYDSMSPEQADGLTDIDTRTDVYSLGILLYELLTGLKPFNYGDIADQEIRRIIREVEPPTPSTRLSQMGEAATTIAEVRHAALDALTKQLSSELEWIPLMAMRKERERRYASAADLAEDVERYLGGKPLLAGPEKVAYRIKKYVLRNRAALMAVAAIAVLLVGGILISSIEALRARRAEHVVIAQRDEVTAGKKEAERQRNQAVTANNRAEAEARMVKSQLSNHYVEQGFAAWDKNDPAVACLWFVKSLKLRIDDLAWERRQRIRIASSLESCPRPLDVPEEQIFRGLHTANRFGFREIYCDWGKRELVILDRRTNKTLLSVAGKFFDSASFSPDGKKFVTTDGTTMARIWDSSTGKPLTPPMSHTAQMLTAKFSPDGSRIITISMVDNSARVWDARTGKQLTPPLGQGTGVNSASFSPDGERIVTAGTDGIARVWDAGTGKLLPISIAHESSVNSASFSSDGKRVVSVNVDNTAQVWDSATGKPLVSLGGDGSVIGSSAEFSPDGNRIVTGISPDYPSRLWFAKTGRPLSSPLHGGYLAPFNCADDNQVIIDQWDKAMVWEVNPGRPTVLAGTDVISGALFDPNGQRVTTANADNVRVWDVQTGKPLTPPMDLSMMLDTDGSASYSFDGRRVATLDADDNHVRVWDVTSGRQLSSVVGDWGSPCLSPDGKVIFAIVNNTMRIWDADSGRSLSVPIGHIKDASFSPDGSRILTVGDDETARVWDARTQKFVARPTFPAFSASFSPDGKRIVTVNRGGMQVWDSSIGKPLTKPMQALNAFNAVFSPDGSRIMTVGGQDVQVWDSKSGQPLTPPVEYEGYLYPTFSPDGEKIAMAVRSDNTREREEVCVLDTNLCKPLTPPLALESVGAPAIFSSDGSRILTMDEDKNAQIWAAPRPTHYSVEQLQMLAELLSFHRIDEAENLVSLNEQEWNQRWETLRREIPEFFRPPVISLPSLDVLPAYRAAVEKKVTVATAPSEQRDLAKRLSFDSDREWQVGLFAEAILLAQTAVKLDDSLVEAYDNLARAYFDAQRYDDALAILQRFKGVHLNRERYDASQKDVLFGQWASNAIAEQRAAGGDSPTFVEIINLLFRTPRPSATQSTQVH